MNMHVVLFQWQFYGEYYDVTPHGCRITKSYKQIW